VFRAASRERVVPGCASDFNDVPASRPARRRGSRVSPLLHLAVVVVITICRSAEGNCSFSPFSSARALFSLRSFLGSATAARVPMTRRRDDETTLSRSTAIVLAVLLPPPIARLSFSSALVTCRLRNTTRAPLIPNTVARPLRGFRLASAPFTSRRSRYSRYSLTFIALIPLSRRRDATPLADNLRERCV